MKKIIFIITIFILSFNANAQIKIGLKMSPNISWSRVIAPQELEIRGNGAKIRFGGGIFLDFMFSEKYALSTGLIYTTKGAGYRSSIADTSGNVIDEKYLYSLQYLELPITLKLYTNEIATDMRLYFQIGGTFNTNLAAKVDKEKSFTNSEGEAVDYAENFRFFDLSALVSAGVERQMGTNTWVFGGFTYNRGLFNIDKVTSDTYNGYEMYNEYVSMDFGLKF